MTQQLATNQTDAATFEASPRQAALQEVNIYSHSTLLYWWPAWVFGFVIAVLNTGQERFLPTPDGGQPSSALGLTYLSILFVFLFLTVRLRSFIRSLLSLVPVLIAVCSVPREGPVSRLRGRKTLASLSGQATARTAAP